MRKEHLRLYLLMLLFFPCYQAVAQDVTTVFNNSPQIQSNGETASLYSVRLSDNYTFVTIELIPTKNRRRMNYFTSGFTRIEFSDYALRFLGALSSDGNSYHSCEPDNQWGWSDVKKGEHYYYTLVFEGRLPYGCTVFSIVDDYSPYHGYSFRNYTINNPDPVENTKLTETDVKKLSIEDDDGIVGIYSEVGGQGYQLGCIKSSDGYKILYLGGKESFTWWHKGDVKAIITPTQDKGIFRGKWYLASKEMTNEVLCCFDGTSMSSLIDGEKCRYRRVFPSYSDSVGKGKWTGSGFAINGGHIVTNHHVIDGAKSISVERKIGDSKQEYLAHIVASDKVNDLAIIKVDGQRWNVPYSIKLQTSDIGEPCFVLGFPLTESMGTDIKLTNGIISSKTGYQGNVNTYQISVPIQPGNSGGPLFNDQGEIIGIVNAKLTNAENVSYAIKTSYLQALIESFSSIDLLPHNNTLSGMTLPKQVSTISPYVFYIKCND